ncbi:MAG: quinone oxidoreductase [Pseudomonadota bacterium]
MTEYRVVVRRPGGVDQFAVEDLEVLTPAAGEVLIRHTAIGLNYIDVYHRSGLYPTPTDTDFVIGAEAAGVIEALGDGVDDLAVGQRVVYTAPFNAYQTHRTLPADLAVPLPDNVDDVTAAASCLKGLTVRYLIFDSYPARSGDTVLFHAAAGGVGLIAGQWLQALGVNAIGTAGTEEKCALARDFGYEFAINYREVSFVHEIERLTDGEGVSAVYDGVGKDTYPGSLDCLKRFGTFVSFGQSSGPAANFKIADLARGSLRLQRPTLFHYTEDRRWLQDGAAELYRHIGDGVIRIQPPNELGLKDVAKAHMALESRKTSGSTVLIP